MKIKIQSESDIITNSSSEVFMVIDTNNVNNIKTLIQNLLTAFGIKEPMDDILYISPCCYDSAYTDITKLILTGHLQYSDYGKYNDTDIEEGYPLCDNEDNITDDMILKAAIYYNTHSRQYKDGEGCPPVDGIELLAKDDKYKDIAEAITDMINNNPFEVFYC